MILNEMLDSEWPRGLCLSALQTESDMALRTVPSTRSRALPSDGRC